MDFMTGLKRTHYCGDLRLSDAGKKVSVAGWLRTVRDSKAFAFVSLSDGSAFAPVQIVLEREKIENYRI